MPLAFHSCHSRERPHKMDTLGDKIMTPVVYQNRNGTESLWADQTNILNFPNGPTIIRWYQFDVTGGTFPATAVQQQDWSNGGDGLWRFMPSLAVDKTGNTAIGYAISSESIFPGIRYAGRLETDPPNNLGPRRSRNVRRVGSKVDTVPLGRLQHDHHRPGRWHDFWHVNEYLTTTSSSSWSTKIG